MNFGCLFLLAELSAVFSFEFMCIDGNWVAGCRLMSMLPPTAVSEMSMVAGPFSSCSPMLLKGVVFLPMRILVLVLVIPLFNYSVSCYQKSLFVSCAKSCAAWSVFGLVN